MLQFAKLLHCKGFHIIFVNTEFNHKRFLKSRSGLDSSEGFPDFQFETIPDPTRNATFVNSFSDLLAKFTDTTSVTCIISDGFLPFTIKAGEEIGVPTVLFFTISACSFMGFKQFRTLKEKGITNNKSHLTKEYLDTVVDWIPGMNNKNIRIRDLPSFERTTNPDDLMFNLTMEATDQASKASFIVIHTFQALEIQVLDALSSMFSHQHEPKITSLGCNLWKPDSKSIQWLDAQKPGSVIYMNFGSSVKINEQKSEQVKVQKSQQAKSASISQLTNCNQLVTNLTKSTCVTVPRLQSKQKVQSSPSDLKTTHDHGQVLTRSNVSLGG
ncbi:hypothetical protein ACOSQ2_009949 [Xanthoceras sorbifolium]